MQERQNTGTTHETRTSDAGQAPSLADDELRKASEALLIFLDGRPDHQMRGADLSTFYTGCGNPHKETITNAKVDGHPKGIRSLCGAFPDVLAYRKSVCDKTSTHVDIVIMRVGDLRHATATTRLATRLAMSYSSTRGDDGRRALEIIEATLRELKIELGSMNQLKREVRERGICLRDGTEHGKLLSSAVRSGKAPRVSKEMAKAFPHAKQCLVRL